MFPEAQLLSADVRLLQLPREHADPGVHGPIVFPRFLRHGRLGIQHANPGDDAVREGQL